MVGNCLPHNSHLALLFVLLPLSVLPLCALCSTAPAALVPSDADWLRRVASRWAGCDVALAVSSRLQSVPRAGSRPVAAHLLAGSSGPAGRPRGGQEGRGIGSRRHGGRRRRPRLLLGCGRPLWRLVPVPRSGRCDRRVEGGSDSQRGVPAGVQLRRHGSHPLLRTRRHHHQGACDSRRYSNATGIRALCSQAARFGMGDAINRRQRIRPEMPNSPRLCDF